MAKRGVNKTILLGNLGQDPEIRYMPNGNAVANLTLATSESYKDKNTGEQKETTEWHRIAIFGKLAEIAGEYLRKGSQVYFEGKLQTRKWTDQQGVERYTTEVVIDSFDGVMQMIGSKPDGQSNQAPHQGGYNQPQQQQPQNQGGYQQQQQHAPQNQPQHQQQNNASYQHAPQQSNQAPHQGGYNQPQQQQPQNQGGYQQQQQHAPQNQPQHQQQNNASYQHAPQQNNQAPQQQGGFNPNQANDAPPF